MTETDPDRESLGETVRETFPKIDDIEDYDLRSGTIDAWTLSLSQTGTTDLEAVPWFPPAQARIDRPEERLVDHVRDVVKAADALASVVAARGTSISQDLVLAGALVHDVSKLFEFDGFEETPIGDLLGHPHYGVYVIGAVDLPVELAHIVLSHTSRTTVEPATIEAEVVRRADEVAASAIRADAVSDLRDA